MFTYHQVKLSGDRARLSMEAGTSTAGWRPRTQHGVYAARPIAGRAAKPALLHHAAAAQVRCINTPAALPTSWPSALTFRQQQAALFIGSCSSARSSIPASSSSRSVRPLHHPRPVRVAAEDAAEASTSSQIDSASSSSGSASGSNGGASSGSAYSQNPPSQMASSSSTGSSEASSSSGGGSGGASGGAAELHSFDLQLPASSSGSTGLDDLDDVELQQQAQVGAAGVFPCLRGGPGDGAGRACVTIRM